MLELEPVSWLMLGLNAGSTQELYAHVQEQIGCLEFSETCLIPDARYGDLAFPKAKAQGHMGPPALHEQLVRMPRSGPVSSTLCTGIPSYIIPTELAKLAAQTPAYVPALEAMQDYGLVAGLTVSAPDRRNRGGTLLMCTWTQDLSAFHAVASTHAGWLSAAIVYLREGMQVQQLAREEEPPRLSQREHECLAWVASGKSTKEIADLLNLADSTVNEYLRNAARKLQASNRTQAAARATLLGLVHP